MGNLQNRATTVLFGAPAVPAAEVHSLGSVIVISNATETIIVTQGVFVDLNFNAAAVLGSNATLWSISDTTTAELTYDGVADHDGELHAVMSATSVGGAQEFNFRAVKNGVPFSDGVLATRAFTSSLGSMAILVPVVVSTGDTVRLQVANLDGTSNITISQLSLEID